ncbi:MAG: cytochrome c oxidase assembly protein, partial [Pseudomonadota bacterium]
MTIAARWGASLTVVNIFTARPAFAHADAPTWGLGAEPWLAVILVIALALYVRGLYALQSTATNPTHVKRLAVCFALGWAAIAIALVSPLAFESAGLYSAHMVQHELLMVIGAPLMVLGRPLAIWTWGLPAHSRPAAARPFRQRAVSAAWHLITTPLSATLLHAAAIWVWHVPYLFERAQSSEILHALQHSAFLFSALLFWWMLLKPGGEQRIGAALLCLFITML